MSDIEDNLRELVAGVAASYFEDSHVPPQEIPAVIAHIAASLAPVGQLKRHLTLKGLSPADYRATWGLPHDYPLTAPAYSARRSELAKSLGLGRKAGFPVRKTKR